MATSRVGENLDRDHGEPGVVSALGRAVESAQGLVVNRIDLAKLDVLDTMSDMMRAGGVLIWGSLVMAIGWASLSVAAVLLMESWSGSLGLSAALVGGVNLIGGAVVLWFGSRAPLEANGKATNGA